MELSASVLWQFYAEMMLLLLVLLKLLIMMTLRISNTFCLYL